MNDHGLSPDGSRPITRICAAYQTDAGRFSRYESIDCAVLWRPYFLTESSTESYLVIVGGRRQKTGVRIAPIDRDCSTRSTRPSRRRAHPKQAALRSGLWGGHCLLASVPTVAGWLQILPSTVRRKATAMRQRESLTSPMLTCGGHLTEHWLRFGHVWPLADSIAAS